MKIAALPSSPDWWSLLTRDEQRIAQLITQGRSNSQIAEELNVTTAAIADQIRGIYRKTGYRSRLQLALAMLGRQ